MHSKLVLELGSKQVLVPVVHSKREPVQVLEHSKVLAPVLVHNMVLVLALVHSMVLEQEQVLGSKLALALGNMLVLVLGSKAQVLDSIELYACNIFQKGQLPLGLLRLQNMQALKV